MALRHFWSYGQLGGLEEGVETVGVVAIFAEKLVEGFMEFHDVVRDPVGKISILRLVPNAFHRIEFWRVTWEPFDAEPGASRVEQSADGRPMSRETVADEQQRSSQVVVHVTQESNNV